MTNFAELEKIDVTEHIEKKGKFSYLSWPFAVSAFRRECPNGVWCITKSNGLPFTTYEGGAFVHVTVYPDITTQSICFEQWHPVLDNNNRPILKPTSFQVNTSIQRALVKAIAIATGIGLHIYAGEDLPPGGNDNGSADLVTTEQATEIDLLVKDTKTDVARFLEWAGCQDISRIPASKYGAAMSLLNAKKNKNVKPEPGSDG